MPTGYYVAKMLKHEQAIEKAREATQERHFDAVYLATEDKRILAKFQKLYSVFPEP